MAQICLFGRTPISGLAAFSRYRERKLPCWSSSLDVHSRSSLGIALRNVRSCGRVSPISAGEHLGIAPEGRSLLRSEPSSRTALMGEQPNPWDLLQPQDAMSRHRGAKPPRRCGLLGEISLLSPG